MIKTIKVEQDYYDKVKALADASGQTMTEASNGVVGAGLGELKELGSKLTKRLDARSVPASDEEITITETPRKVKADDKSKVKAEKQSEEAVGYECVECGSDVTPEMEFCSECHTKLNWNSAGSESEESEGDSSWIWIVGLLFAALALKRRVEQNNLLNSS